MKVVRRSLTSFVFGRKGDGHRFYCEYPRCKCACAHTFFAVSLDKQEAKDPSRIPVSHRQQKRCPSTVFFLFFCGPSTHQCLPPPILFRTLVPLYSVSPIINRALRPLEFEVPMWWCWEWSARPSLTCRTLEQSGRFVRSTITSLLPSLVSLPMHECSSKRYVRIARDERRMTL